MFCCNLSVCSSCDLLLMCKHCAKIHVTQRYLNSPVTWYWFILIHSHSHSGAVCKDCCCFLDTMPAIWMILDWSCSQRSLQPFCTALLKLRQWIWNLWLPKFIGSRECVKLFLCNVFFSFLPFLQVMEASDYWGGLRPSQCSWRLVPCQFEGKKYFLHIRVSGEPLWGTGRLPCCTLYSRTPPPTNHPWLPERERTAATMVLSQRQRDELWVRQC